MFAEEDIYFMRKALHIASCAKGTTFPNPAVGAVVVHDDVIVGEGVTSIYGGPHAERNALDEAGSMAAGSTLYVSLEPCNHFGKTPPCTQAIIEAGITRVVIATKDPNPLINGKGMDVLHDHGIAITYGCEEKNACAFYEDFFWSIEKKLPWISLKLAVTLDGRIADHHGESQWISNKIARIHVHELRKNHAAIVVGSTTVQRDDPRLTLRYVRGKTPVRIVFASKTIPDTESYFRRTAQSIRSIIVTDSGEPGTIRVEPDGVEVWSIGEQYKFQSLVLFLHMAYNAGLSSILLEGGQKIASTFLESRLVNKLYLYYGNKIFGAGVDMLHFSKGLCCADAFVLNNHAVQQFEDTIMISGTLCTNL